MLIRAWDNCSQFMKCQTVKQSTADEKSKNVRWPNFMDASKGLKHG